MLTWLFLTRDLKPQHSATLFYYHSLISTAPLEQFCTHNKNSCLLTCTLKVTSSIGGGGGKAPCDVMFPRSSTGGGGGGRKSPRRKKSRELRLIAEHQHFPESFQNVSLCCPERKQGGRPRRGDGLSIWRPAPGMTREILTALPLLLWQSTHHLTIKYSTASLADPGDGRDSSGALSDCLEVLGTRRSTQTKTHLSFKCAAGGCKTCTTECPTSSLAADPKQFTPFLCQMTPAGFGHSKDRISC